MRQMRQMKLACLIATVTVVAAGCRASAAQCNANANDPAVVVRDGLGATVDSMLTAAPGAGAFVGTVLIARNGELLLHKGYGCADRARAVPNTTRTVYDIGTLTKQFTAAAILKLEEEGKLSLDDSLGRFFPAMQGPASAVTVEQLLTNRSGLFRTFGDNERALTRDAVVERAQQRISTGRGFSNESLIAYTLLAGVIEEASEMTYEGYLREHLLDRAGLARTGYLREAWTEDDVAVGYRTDGVVHGTPLRQPRAEDGFPWWEERGNTGLLSSPGELYRWLGDSGNEVLGAQSREMIFSAGPVSDDGRNIASPGFGWRVRTTPRKTRHVTHQAEPGVFYARVDYYPDENTIAIVATNRNDEGLRQLWPEVLDQIFPPPPR
jgi:CubicO group peptidase (beta-lactamase class C family)